MSPAVFRNLEVKHLVKPEQQDQAMKHGRSSGCLAALRTTCVCAVLCCAVLRLPCSPRLHVAVGLLAALSLHLPPGVLLLTAGSRMCNAMLSVVKKGSAVMTVCPKF